MSGFFDALIRERNAVAKRGHMPRRLKLLDELIEHYRRVSVPRAGDAIDNQQQPEAAESEGR